MSTVFAVILMVIVILAVIAFDIGLSLLSSFLKKIINKRLYIQIENEFITSAISNQNSVFSLAPHSAILVLEVGDIRQSVHRIYRSCENEYFLFIFTADEPPYFTHLTKERAKNALRFDTKIFQKEFPNG